MFYKVLTVVDSAVCFQLELPLKATVPLEHSRNYLAVPALTVIHTTVEVTKTAGPGGSLEVAENVVML